MSVRIYKIGGSGATTTSLKGVHSLVNLESGQSTSQCIHSSNLTTLICKNNGVVSAPFIPNQTFAADSFSLFVQTADAGGGKVRVMVYSNTDSVGTAGLPDLLLISTNDMSLSATGKVTSDTGLKFTFTEGTTYWIAVQSGSSIAILSAIPVGNLLCIANKTSDGTPFCVYTGSRNYNAGAQDPFSDYAPTAYATTEMPLVLLNIG